MQTTAAPGKLEHVATPLSPIRFFLKADIQPQLNTTQNDFTIAKGKI